MSTVVHIQILDENTANQIAAGEVVERPAAVVKELVENAIDAGSTNIEIEIKDGGLEFIRVSDNGVGMSFEDARLSVKRHATSKIRTAEDLYKIDTLGFRGEALPSIAAVSKFTLTTRQRQNDLAALISIEGGVFQDIREAGAPSGTTVVVSDIFFNTPARRKFLKTPATEGGYISEIVGKLALSRPDISFKLIQNKKLTLVTNGNGSLLDALASLYGTKAGEEVLPVLYEPGENPGVAVSGYIGKPTLLKSSRAWQTFIVNDRIVVGKILFKAIDNAYFSLLPKGGHPLAILKLSLDADVIDVNVHPQKKEIKFSDEQKVFRAVHRAVLNALQQKIGNEHEKKSVVYDRFRPQFENGLMQAEEVAAKIPPPNDNKSDGRRQFPSTADAAKYAKPANNESGFPDVVLQSKLWYAKTEEAPSLTEAQEIMSRDGNWEKPAAECPQPDDLTTPPETGDFAGLYPLGQIDTCYIVAYKKDGGGLYIIDQHAAHERILYEKLSKNMGQIPSQQLLIPLLLDFAPADCEALAAHQTVFDRLGFSFEQVGPSVMRLTEIPADIAADNAETIVRQALTMLDGLSQPTVQTIRHAYLQIASCRSAIKAGDILTMREMQALVGELGVTDRAYTCPHGRPAVIKFSSAELDKMFKRT